MKITLKNISEIEKKFNKNFELLKITELNNYFLISVNTENDLMGLKLSYHDIKYIIKKLFDFSENMKGFKKIENGNYKILLWKY